VGNLLYVNNSLLSYYMEEVNVVSLGAFEGPTIDAHRWEHY
jgi:hypothetical protein